MTVTEQTKKTYHFISRSVAVDCMKQELDNPKVEQVWFTNKTWIEEGKDGKYEVNVTYLTESR